MNARKGAEFLYAVADEIRTTGGPLKSKVRHVARSLIEKPVELPLGSGSVRKIHSFYRTSSPAAAYPLDVSPWPELSRFKYLVGINVLKAVRPASVTR